MTDPEKLPIEPLDERAWQRIEERVVHTPSVPSAAPREPRRVAALAGLALAVAIVALAVGLWPRVAEAPAPPGIAATAVATDASPSEVRVGAARLELAAHTEIVARGDDARGVHVVLSRGAVTCTVPPRAGRPPFTVEAAGVRVEVVGTRFTVRRDPALEVSVERGVVRVIDGEQVTEVRAGARWARRATAEATPRARPETGATTGATEATEPAPEAAPALVDPAAEFERASSLEARDPDAADAAYARVQRAGGPWAANALYARGRLDAERGRTERSQRFLTSYLRRYPNGLNAADARRLLEDLEDR